MSKKKIIFVASIAFLFLLIFVVIISRYSFRNRTDSLYALFINGTFNMNSLKIENCPKNVKIVWHTHFHDKRTITVVKNSIIQDVDFGKSFGPCGFYVFINGKLKATFVYYSPYRNYSYDFVFKFKNGKVIFDILNDRNVLEDKLCDRCKFTIHNEFYSGSNHIESRIYEIEKQKFRIALNDVVYRMTKSLDLNKSQMIFSIRLANTIYVSEQEYINILLIVFPKIYVFIDKFYTKYFKYIKCNNEHFTAKSGGIDFPNLKIQFEGMPASLSYYFIKIDKKLTPCLVNRFVYFKTICNLKKSQKGRGSKGEINLLDAE